jgi:branched-chain amino acid transport system substrate-binding protein
MVALVWNSWDRTSNRYEEKVFESPTGRRMWIRSLNINNKEESVKRRTICIGIAIGTLICGLFLLMTHAGLGTAAAPVKEIKIALAYPLSGPLSRSGNLTVQGAKAAMAWVNDNGGIKSLGGAKLVPVIADTSSTVEGAASAMDRLCRDPEIVMAMGSWASSLTLSTTEVTERLGIPHFSISLVDTLHERGFKWGFYVSPPASTLSATSTGYVLDLAKGLGRTVKTAMIVGDTSAGSKFTYESERKFLPSVGVKIIGEETWAMGTLTDATPVMQKVKSLNPDIVIFNPTAITETQMCLMKRKEMGIRIPFLTGGYAADSSFRSIGAEALEGMILYSQCYPNKQWPQDWIKRTLEQCKKEYSDEPWVGQDLGYAWSMVPIMAEILERAGSTDREAIRAAAHKMDLHDVMATRAMAKQGIAFEENGRIVQKYQGTLIVQWQKGVPRVVYPSNLAVAKAEWPARK